LKPGQSLKVGKTDMNTLRGKVALVTGAAAKRGMGHGWPYDLG